MGQPLLVNFLLDKTVNAHPKTFIPFRVEWCATPSPDKTIHNPTVRLIGSRVHFAANISIRLGVNLLFA